ncbi:MAG: glycoside hydrolase family 3 N-terminal domain-containing protein [Planctomycetota bacterium]
MAWIPVRPPRRRWWWTVGACLAHVCAWSSPCRADPPTTAPGCPGVAARVEALLAQMTLEEKIGQLTQEWGGVREHDDPAVREQQEQAFLNSIRKGKVGAVLGAHGAERVNQLQRVAADESRLRIPLLVGNDVIHGYQTIFPIPLGEAATWDPPLIEQAARVAAVEASAAGTRWTFAPMVDVCRDPRWGRIAEGAGEDPFLGSALAAARVRGFQGPDLTAPDAVLACAKHYVAYGGAEGGRDYNTVDLSPQTLREVHLPPFEAAVRAGAGSVMSAFNEINGVPASANEWTLTRILRQEWCFEGFVVSDWNSIAELVIHGFAADRADAAALALDAGVDMDMSSFCFRDHLTELMDRGRVSASILDRAVRRVLTAKFRLGLFEHPYTDPQREPSVMLAPQHRALARRVAARSMVLLKNEPAVLPLDPRVAKLAVIGPLGPSIWASTTATWNSSSNPGPSRCGSVPTPPQGWRVASP